MLLLLMAPESVLRKKQGVGAGLEWRLININRAKNTLELICIVEPSLTWRGSVQLLADWFELAPYNAHPTDELYSAAMPAATSPTIISCAPFRDDRGSLAEAIRKS